MSVVSGRWKRSSGGAMSDNNNTGSWRLQEHQYSNRHQGPSLPHRGRHVEWEDHATPKSSPTFVKSHRMEDGQRNSDGVHFMNKIGPYLSVTRSNLCAAVLLWLLEVLELDVYQIPCL
ncbi:hypothetical protein EYF80_026285 [Liparis tanakae]|uniref:Uncharacterized protein n=1 Tax=Liparis tanakae TaxID=230148 RepID=A0A4Z2HDU3_9TELE|nr:hypothetical protein EYF80_026285 [Liparis tanakae]